MYSGCGKASNNKWLLALHKYLVTQFLLFSVIMRICEIFPALCTTTHNGYRNPEKYCKICAKTIPPGAFLLPHIHTHTPCHMVEAMEHVSVWWCLSHCKFLRHFNNIIQLFQISYCIVTMGLCEKL